MVSTAGSSNPTLDSLSTRDSFIPLFSGQHGDYKEWRKRIRIYMMRMNMTKRGHEAILNLVGSLTGVAWKVAEAYDLEDLEKKPAEDHFNRLLKLLDAAFEYDSRVQLAADFDRYFVTLQRRPGQTLLQYVTEHDECLRRLSDHKIDLPKAVQGWHLLRKAGLTREQKQLIMIQAPNLERIKVQEAMFLVLGQDHKAAVSDHRRPYKGKGKGRGYAAVDYETDEIEVDDEMATDSAFYEGSWDDYYEDDGTWETEEIYYENDGARRQANRSSRQSSGQHGLSSVRRQSLHQHVPCPEGLITSFWNQTPCTSHREHRLRWSPRKWNGYLSRSRWP